MVGWSVRPILREGAGPTNHRRKNWPFFETSGSGHFLDLLDLCWTSAGPRSSKETLEKWGFHCAVWTFWTSCRTSGHGTILLGSAFGPPRHLPATAGEFQNVQTAQPSPHFSSVSLLDIGPAEVQQKSSRSRKCPEPLVSKHGQFLRRWLVGPAPSLSDRADGPTNHPGMVPQQLT